MIDQLPARMRAKIVFQPCLVEGLPGPCWVWTGYVMPKGYGQVGFEGKVQLAHRVTYRLLIGPIPDDLQLDHLCRNKSCCNPSHTEPVTGWENLRRAGVVNKLRCVKGHPLFPPNLIIKKQKNGTSIMRNCRVCARDTLREIRIRKGQRCKTYPAILRKEELMLAEAERNLLAAQGNS
jgi:hypothetical protein